MLEGHQGEVRRALERYGGREVKSTGDGFLATFDGLGEVVVSGTVKDLVAGSEIEFADRGTHTLKGTPGSWQPYAVAG